MTSSQCDGLAVVLLPFGVFYFCVESFPAEKGALIEYVLAVSSRNIKDLEERVFV